MDSYAYSKNKIFLLFSYSSTIFAWVASRALIQSYVCLNANSTVTLRNMGYIGQFLNTTQQSVNRVH